MSCCAGTLLLSMRGRKVHETATACTAGHVDLGSCITTAQMKHMSSVDQHILQVQGMPSNFTNGKIVLGKTAADMQHNSHVIAIELAAVLLAICQQATISVKFITPMQNYL